jgi:anti-sigma factor ChrR (cupin superfamily)
MRTSYILALATACVVLSSATLAQQGLTSPNKSVRDPAARLVETPAAELKWTDLDPKGAPGVKVADLWGDHTKGPYGAYFKLPAGFAVPLHTHTHDMKVIFVSGTYIQAPEGKPEFRLGPGSYMMQPGGNYRHTTSCDKSSDCLFFVESTGAFDLKVVEAPKPAGKHP